jgi:hypothetical protein
VFKRSVGLVLFLLVCLAVPAFATDTPPDYGAAATSVSTAITPIVTAVLPVAAGILAILLGPRILLRMVKSFSKG